MKYLQDHWEMLSGFGVMIFGLGGFHSKHNELKEKVIQNENIILAIDNKLNKALLLLERIDERTKGL